MSVDWQCSGQAAQRPQHGLSVPPAPCAAAACRARWRRLARPHLLACLMRLQHCALALPRTVIAARHSRSPCSCLAELPETLGSSSSAPCGALWGPPRPSMAPATSSELGGWRGRHKEAHAAPLESHSAALPRPPHRPCSRAQQINELMVVQPHCRPTNPDMQVATSRVAAAACSAAAPLFVALS